MTYLYRYGKLQVQITPTRDCSPTGAILSRLPTALRILSAYQFLYFSFNSCNNFYFDVVWWSKLAVCLRLIAR